MAVTGNALDVIEAERRPGDPAVLVADSSLAQSELGWKPEYDQLDRIIEHAWNWETSHFHSWPHLSI